MRSAFYIHNNKASIGRQLNSLLHGANVDVDCVGFLLMETLIMCSSLIIYNGHNCDICSCIVFGNHMEPEHTIQLTESIVSKLINVGRYIHVGI